MHAQILYDEIMNFQKLCTCLPSSRYSSVKLSPIDSSQLNLCNEQNMKDILFQLAIGHCILSYSL